MACCVYWIRHPDHTDMTRQGYIGVSVDHLVRWKDHKNYPSNIHLKNAINKYGWDNLIREVLLIADVDYCLMIEASLRPDKNIGWNLAAGGGKPPVTRWNLGKTLSDETKEKISRNRKGKKHTPEMQSILNLNLLSGKKTQFKKGHEPWNIGKSFLPETIEKMRQVKLGKKLTEETKRKIGEAGKGRIMSEYNKQKIIEANKGRANLMKGKHFPDVECPHCGKIGRLTGMKSWHFDNCRVKEAA